MDMGSEELVLLRGNRWGGDTPPVSKTGATQ